MTPFCRNLENYVCSPQLVQNINTCTTEVSFCDKMFSLAKQFQTQELNSICTLLQSFLSRTDSVGYKPKKTILTSSNLFVDWAAKNSIDIVPYAKAILDVFRDDRIIALNRVILKNPPQELGICSAYIIGSKSEGKEIWWLLKNHDFLPQEDRDYYEKQRAGKDDEDEENKLPVQEYAIGTFDSLFSLKEGCNPNTDCGDATFYSFAAIF